MTHTRRIIVGTLAACATFGGVSGSSLASAQPSLPLSSGVSAEASPFSKYLKCRQFTEKILVSKGWEVWDAYVEADEYCDDLHPKRWW